MGDLPSHLPDLAVLADEPMDDVDAGILAQLRDVQETQDPTPTDLADRAAFTITVAALEAEVAELTAVDAAALSLRGEAPEKADTISFSGADLTTMVTIEDGAGGHRRISGWASETPLEVELRRSSEAVTTTTDADGRYAFDDAQPGLVHLVLRRPGQTGATPLATPLFEI